MLVLCFPGFNLSSLAWVALVPLLLSLPRLSFSSAVLWGFAGGLLHHAASLYWIYPTCRWGGTSAPVALLALAALSGYLAVYWALFAALASRLSVGRGARPFVLAAAWVTTEYLRSHVATGFPWLLVAHSQWNVPKHLSLAQWGGVYAVSFLVILFNATLAAGVEIFLKKPRRWKPFAAGTLALVGLTATSVFLWRRTPAEPGAVRVAVVQGNIDQYKKWDEAYVQEILDGYSRGTRAALGQKRDLVVWPETSVPGWYPNDGRVVDWVAGLAREGGIPLLVGAPTRGDGDYNAVFLVSGQGETAGVYRKRHLVPFGEYVPFRSVLGRLFSVLNALGTFDAGASAEPLPGPAPLGVSICFEGLFPALSRESVRAGAAILVNVTNDGWYRDTAAPEQHLAATVFRAVENGRWLVRAANTGISAFVSPRGEIVGRTPLLAPAVLDGAVAPLTHRTPYARWGDLFAVACALSASAALGIGFARAKADPS
ncbi:MAG: apolipoprotein N-acyltransferase [Elusimicrobia bacterium]|nr:apolipoprotein N-acyltransferase [Elusimicrobiota bacterium]MBK8125112.1 apolipoprotein N-acyltransferase [Elusimicrobiota bacterium]MBK9921632.1 apolipoprotein N-acyltransferase [Elusimicrobiota bacterium]